MKRVLCFALLLCMLLVMFPSCEEEEMPDETTTGGKTSVTTGPDDDKNATVLDLFVAGVAKFDIVIPEGDDALYEVADGMADMCLKYCGSKPKIKLDFEVGKNDDLQLLIGKTSLPESAEALKQATRYKDYFCGVIGNKLVLVGNTDECTESAVNYFKQYYLMQYKKGSKADLSFSSAKNRVYVYNYNITSATIAGENVTDYSIVYPDVYFAGERYAAVRLQYHLFDYGGFIVPAETASTVKNDKQIVFRNQAGSNGFAIKAEGKKLIVTGDDLFDFQDALTYLTTKLFAGSKTIDIASDFSYSSKNTSDVLRQCTGDYRLWFHNIWGMDEEVYSKEGSKTPVTNIRDDNEVALLLAYQPDVICFNEYWGLYKTLDVVRKQLLANGYSEADAKKAQKYPEETYNAMPVFYKTSRFNCLETNYYKFPEANDVSKGMTLTVLQDKVTNKKIGVAAVHLSALFGLSSVEQKLQRQAGEAKIVHDEIASIASKYGDIPVFFGGDMNCEIEQSTMQWFMNNDFVSLHDAATDANNDCSCNGYPGYSEIFKVYNTGVPNKGNYARSIDHSFAYNSDKVTVNTYRTLQDPIVAQISDHCPQFADITMK